MPCCGALFLCLQLVMTFIIRKEGFFMVNQMRYNSVLSSYMYAYIKEKEAIGHTVTQTKWFSMN